MRGKAECSGSGGGMVRTAKLSKRKAERGVSVRSELSDGWGRDRRREEEILGNETTDFTGGKDFRLFAMQSQEMQATVR